MKNISRFVPVFGLAMLLVTTNPASASADGSGPPSGLNSTSAPQGTSLEWQPIVLDSTSSPQVADRYYQVGLFTDGASYQMDVHIEAGAVISDICLMEVDSVPQSGPNAHIPQGKRICVEQPDGSDVTLTLPIAQSNSGIEGFFYVKEPDSNNTDREEFCSGWSSFSESTTGVVLATTGK